MSEDESVSDPISESSEISVVENVEQTKKCVRCEQTYPLNTLYFRKSGKSLHNRCHECHAKDKIDQGTIPRWPAKNGVDQIAYHAELTAAAKKDKVAKPAKPATNPTPWLSAASGAIIDSTPPPPGQGRTIKVFDLDSNVKRDSSGVFVLTMNDYFKFHKFHRVPDEQPKNAYAQPASSVPVDPDDDLGGDEGDDYEEGDSEFDDESEGRPMHPEDLRRALIINIATYPRVAEHLQLTYSRVHEMEDREVWGNYRSFQALKVLQSGTNLGHTALRATADVIEKTLTGRRLPGGRVIDLSGFAEEMNDPTIVETLSEVVADRQEIINKIEPEYRLLGQLLFKAYAVDSRNHALKQKLSQQ